MTRRKFLTYGAAAPMALSLLGARAFAATPGELASTTSATPAGLDSKAIANLIKAIRGPVILPRDHAYDARRRVYSWNPVTDKFPALIVRCANQSDVVQSIAFAHANKLEVAVRGGAHDIQGSSVCGGGMVIDLSPMKHIAIDRDAQIAHVGPGVTAGELNTAAHLYGLAACLGCDPGPGVSGVSLGGGMGWLMAKYGAACDNLVSAEVVTADAQSQVASAERNQELFWALRGGGGNFGIVTGFEFKLHPVKKVFGGFLAYPVSQARQFYAAYRELMAMAPDELVVETVSMAAYEGIPFRQPIVMAIACYCGDPQAGEQILKPLRSLSQPLADSIGVIPYTALQRHPPLSVGRVLLGNKGVGSVAIKPLNRSLQYNHWKASAIENLTDAAIDTLVGRIEGAPRGWMIGVGHHMHGAVSRVDSSETAFVRRPGFSYFFEEDWFDPAEADAAMAWVDRSWDAMQPYSHEGTYVNFLSVTGDDAVKMTYGANYPRLALLKSRYDPDNFFHLNRNIKPSREPA
ncbi:MAG TPA: FAD-binding oxidoreductase [Candidatus Acidoferrales bacterium]|nr:FAD-binding oxidoreductase [Candidatus Acidoferrales bacterium]